MFLFLTLCILTIVCLDDVCYVISYRLQCNQNYPESLANKNSQSLKRHANIYADKFSQWRKKHHVIQFSKILARFPHSDMWPVCSCWITLAVWCSEPVIRFNGCSILYSCHLTSPDCQSSTLVVPSSVCQDKLSMAVTFPIHVSMQNTNLQSFGILFHDKL